MTFHWNPDHPPFSFQYGERPSADFLAGWERRPDGADGPDGRQYGYRDPATRLRIDARVRRLDGLDAWEWVLELTNEGSEDTPILAALRVLDLELPVAGDANPVLHHAKGSLCEIDDFMPRRARLSPNRELTLAPLGGRSSNGVLPFMNLQTGDGGLVLAIGWSGGWEATFRRSGDGVRVTAGMQHTHLRLHPGETIRTPRMLAISWQGDDPDTGTNLLRRTLLAHYSQRLDGELALPPTAHPRQLVYYFTGHVSEADHLAAIDRAREIGLEAFWVDALWYGEGENWAEEVGNWTINRRRFPRGLKPIADKAHANGMKFILWFEPERVRPKTPLAKDHPEFLLRHPHGGDNLLFDLGNPAARQWMTDTISAVISEVGVDIYRQDCNIDPMEYWLAADGPDRRGMTEIRHIEGLYAMWDELRRRHPGLIIDNCASGGRRLDLETTSRAFPLWRSDYTDAGAAREGFRCEVGAQCQTAGLSRWLPLHTASVWRITPYSVRSSVSTGLVFYPDIRPDDYPVADARLAIAEMARLRPFFLGDHHLLLPLTDEEHDWCAHQFHRPDLNAGFAFFFRRHASPFPALECGLKQIDVEAEYEVTTAIGWERTAPRRARGADLAEMTVRLPERPSSQLLEYRKLG